MRRLGGPGEGKKGDSFGLNSYTTLASLPGTGANNVSYKVTNDPTATNNGYYHWNGSAYVKDANLANGVIASGNVDAVTGGEVFKYSIPLTQFTESKNLFNGEIVVGSYLSSSTGGVIDTADTLWKRTKHIPVVAGNKYTISGTRGRQGLSFFTSDGATTAIASSYNGTNTNPMTITAPAGALFMVVNLTSSSATTYSNIQIEKGEFATAYAAFNNKISKEKVINAEYEEKKDLKITISQTAGSYIESYINGKVLRQKLRIFGTGSLPFDLSHTYYDGVLIRSVTDDSAPYRLDGATLGASHDSGANNLNRSFEMFVDGVKVTEYEKTYSANKFTVVERYDLNGFNTAGIIAKVVNKYVFDGRGNVVSYVDYYAVQTVLLTDIMFLMAQRMETPYSLYIPKALDLTHESVNYSFAAIRNMAGFAPAARIDFTPSRCTPTGIMCDRAIQIKSNINLQVGFLPVQDAETARRRALCTEKALQISQDGKIYMSAYDPADNTTLNAGEYYSVVAYKGYSVPEAGTTSSYVVQKGKNEYYAFYDWHSNFNGRINLEESFSGMNITVVEKSSGVTVLSKEITKGILVDVVKTNLSEYLILKIN